ncbi:MAG: type II toxin-antitoxin system prevent-host-death family antitoxin [Burkholderiales bacterium]|nr:type II toxin-antitoxin system prevent-host-death family antitoxin [Opitutaceae bacterium]
MSNKLLDMKSASIRTMQHQLAALVAEVEQGEEILITRRNVPVARLSPIIPSAAPSAGSAAAIRAYWRRRPLPPAVRSSVTHADLIAEGRGDV